MFSGSSHPLGSTGFAHSRLLDLLFFFFFLFSHLENTYIQVSTMWQSCARYCVCKLSEHAPNCQEMVTDRKTPCQGQGQLNYYSNREVQYQMVPKGSRGTSCGSIVGCWKLWGWVSHTPSSRTLVTDNRGAGETTQWLRALINALFEGLGVSS